MPKDDFGHRPKASPSVNNSKALSDYSPVSFGRTIFVCPQCDKAFGKSIKLDRHVHVHHSVTLSIPPDILTSACSRPHSRSPPPSQRDTTTTDESFTPEEVQSALVAALHEANRSFDAGNRLCPRCPASRSFATRKDLAAHIVAKHADSDMRTVDGTVLASPSAAAAASVTSASSHVSPIKPVTGVKRAAELVSAPTAKRIRMSDDHNTNTVTPSGTKPPMTPKKGNPIIPPKAQALSAARQSDLIQPSTSDIIANPSLHPESSEKSATPVVSSNSAPGAVSSQRKQSAVLTLDFSAMADIFTNSHKSYYRLVDP